MKNKHIDVDLTFTITGMKLLVHLVFSNNTSKKLWVNKFLICYKNSIRRSLFRIVDDKSCIVKYRGPTERSISERNYLPMHPGETIESSIVLNEVYEISKGMKYTVQYLAVHPAHFNSSQVTRVESALFEIVY